MSDIIRMIMRDVEDDPSIKSHDISYEAHSKGLFRKRRFIRIFGSTDSELSKGKVQRVAEHHSGDNYDVVNELAVRDSKVRS